MNIPRRDDPESRAFWRLVDEAAETVRRIVERLEEQKRGESSAVPEPQV